MLAGRVSRILRRISPSIRPLTTAAPACSAKLEKIVDEISQLNLLEVSEFVKILKTRLDIPDMMAAPMMMAGGPAAPAAAEEAPVVKEKTSFTVKLTGFDAVNKVKTIKEVRAITKLGLKEAKALVESAPCDVIKDINKADAEAILQQLKDAGAQVELV